MKNFTIRKKLIVQTFIPIAVILILSAMFLNTQFSKVGKLQNIQTASSLLNSISLLVHELQKERGMSAGYLGSHGKRFKQKLFNQRKLTDQRLAQLKEKLQKSDIADVNKQVSETINIALQDISKLQSMREKIISLQIETSKAISYYTNMNAHFLYTIVVISTVPSTPEISK
jgi:methyl-accepting chemotaxis protein